MLPKNQYKFQNIETLCLSPFPTDNFKKYTKKITILEIWVKNSPVFHHLAECNFYQYTLTLHSFPCDGDVTLTNQDILGHIRTTVTDNMRIIGKSENWAELCFLKSLNIKWKKLSLNNGIKATKELALFS